MIHTITVLGGGTMGYGIALNFALGGYAVNLVDISREVLDRTLSLMKDSFAIMVEEGANTKAEGEKAFAMLTLTTDRDAACREADLLMEALPENVELKQKVFAELDAVCKPECIFASNTSSLTLTDICARLSDERKARSVITHYFNPAHLIPLVETMKYPGASDAALDAIDEVYRRSGKVTIRVLKDINGMIANRIQSAILREAIWLLEHGYCSEKDLGRAMVFGPCFRYATTDYLEILDMGGLDIWTVVQERLFKELNNAREVSPLLRSKAEQGNYGWKTGKGFYDYSGSKKEESMERFVRNLIKQLNVSKNYLF